MAKKLQPLARWGGYRGGGEEAIKAEIVPGESLRGLIMEWVMPPFAPFYPGGPPFRQGSPPVLHQSSVSIAPTNAAVYFVALTFVGNSAQAASATRISGSQISAVSVGRARRMNKARRRFLGEVEEVVLLKLWWANKVEFVESRYEEALEQGRAIERLVSEWQGGGGASRPGVADELEKLAQLRADGILTNDEWDRAKDLFLGKAPDAQQQAVVLLGQLHNLFRAGALSESEFNMKKWDILAKR